MITIGKLEPSDRAQWEVLFRRAARISTSARCSPMYDRAWNEFARDTRMHALGARFDGRLVGITHFLIHANTSSDDVCYLQDLFTEARVRGKGVARALIQVVADWAKTQGCPRLYWQTQASNTTARPLRQDGREPRLHSLRYRAGLTPALADVGDRLDLDEDFGYGCVTSTRVEAGNRR